MQDLRRADDKGENIVHRRLDISEDRLGLQLVETVAHFEDCDSSDLPPIHERIDHHVRLLFSDSLLPDPRETVELLYEGYRIILYQGGQATFIKLPEGEN